MNEVITKMKFNGRKIKIRRVELDITQKEVARRCNIALGTMSGIEKHSKYPNLKTLLDIADVLKVDLNYFFEDK